MAYYYQKGNIDVENYSFGVISDVGCLSVIIVSEDLYSTFANKIYNTDKGSDKDIMDSWTECIINVTYGIPEESIGKIIIFFNQTNAGLSVMFRPMSPENKGNHTGEDWTAKTVNENGKYINKDCK